MHFQHFTELLLQKHNFSIESCPLKRKKYIVVPPNTNRSDADGICGCIRSVPLRLDLQAPAFPHCCFLLFFGFIALGAPAAIQDVITGDYYRSDYGEEISDKAVLDSPARGIDIKVNLVCRGCGVV